MGETNSGPPAVISSLLDEIGRALFSGLTEAILAKIDDLRTQLVGLKTDTDAMQGRVLAGVADLKAQIQALKDQLVNVDVPQEITDLVAAVDTTINALDPTKPDVLPTESLSRPPRPPKPPSPPPPPGPVVPVVPSPEPPSPPPPPPPGPVFPAPEKKH